MRHGLNKANEQGLIVSHPDNGLLPDYGLAELGREQARRSATASSMTSRTLIFSSDFSRTVETADIVREVLGADAVQTTSFLRERSFGDYEKTNHGNYELVWNDDERDSSHKNNAVESVDEVIDRVTGFIIDLEVAFTDQDILLVSHGDILQILQTAFQKLPGSRHRSLPHLETAEIRQLTPGP